MYVGCTRKTHHIHDNLGPDPKTELKFMKSKSEFLFKLHNYILIQNPISSDPKYIHTKIY